MKFWTRWRVATRLALTFTLIGITCLALLAGSFIQQRRANTAIESISVAEINKLTDTYELSAMALSVTPRVVAVNMTADPALHKALGPEIVPLLVQIDKKVEKISGWAQSSEEKAWLIKLAETGASIRQSLAEVEKIRKSGDAEGARDAFIRLVKPKATHYDELLVEFTKFQRAQFAANSMALQEAGWNAWAISAAAGAAVLVLVSLMLALLMRGINASMREANRVAAEVSKGNLTVQADVSGSDEFAQLNRSLNEMALSLERVVRRVRGATQAITIGAQEIAQGSQDLSQRTENQAGHLQQTASTMEELASTVRQSADSADRANELSSEAREIAARGNSAVKQVISTMSQIESSSRRIEEIIVIIDGISFQTNILALNAAVEAARAGEQGRGFAVVANEVRQLAQRSAVAAKEIKQLIDVSSESVSAGSSQVLAAGQTMSALQASVEQVSTLIGEISAAAKEQHYGIAGVSQSVNVLDQATQQNTAMVEESAAAAAYMRDQANELTEAVGIFRMSAELDAVRLLERRGPGHN